MRKTERISTFLKWLDWDDFVTRYKIDYNPRELYTNWIEKIVITWLENPDWRFGQCLINLGIVPDNLVLWHVEENDILKFQGVEPREYLRWGTYGLGIKDRLKKWKKTRKKFGLSKKDIEVDPMKLVLAKDKKSRKLLFAFTAWYDTRPQAEYKLIKDLDTEHIENILKTQPQITKEYKEVFEAELKLRK